MNKGLSGLRQSDNLEKVKVMVCRKVVKVHAKNIIALGGDLGTNWILCLFTTTSFPMYDHFIFSKMIEYTSHIDLKFWKALQDEGKLT